MLKATRDLLKSSSLHAAAVFRVEANNSNWIGEEIHYKDGTMCDSYRKLDLENIDWNW